MEKIHINKVKDILIKAMNQQALLLMEKERN